MKFLIILFALAVYVNCDDCGKEMDTLLERLRKMNLKGPHGHRTSRYYDFRHLIQVGGQGLIDILFGGIQVPGIENLKRTSASSGSSKGSGICSEVDYSVKGGINITIADLTFSTAKLNRIEHPAILVGTWKNPSEDAVFSLKEVSFKTGNKFNLKSLTTNVDPNKFEFTLECKKPEEQGLCDELMRYQPSKWNFHFSRYFEDIFRGALSRCTL